MQAPSLFSLVHYAVALALAVAIIVSAGDIARTHAHLAEILSPEARTEAAWQGVLEALSLGLYSGAEEARVQITALNAHMLTLWGRANILSVSLVVWLSLFLSWQARRGTRQRKQAHMLASASICLIIGLLAPMMSIVAQREVPMLGEVVLRYESKAILTTVYALAEKQHWLIALALAMTSVLLPIGKLLLAAIATAGPQRLSAQSRRYVHIIGRWSFTDVFVVAVLLAFMAGDAGDSTNAWVGHGLWFFTGYAVLSWLVTQQLDAQPGTTATLQSSAD
jgi:hypothetical protein